MDSPEPTLPSPKHYNLGDSLAFLGLAIAVITWALAPNFLAKSIAVLFGMGLLVYLSYKSHFVKNFPKWCKHASAAAIFLVVLAVALLQLIPQWKEEHHETSNEGNVPKQPQAQTEASSQTTQITQKQIDESKMKLKQIEESSDATMKITSSQEEFAALTPSVVASMLRSDADVIEQEWNGYFSVDDLLYHKENIAQEDALAALPKNSRKEAGAPSAALAAARKPFDEQRSALKNEYIPNILKHMMACDKVRVRAVVMLGLSERPEQEEKNAMFLLIEEGKLPLNTTRERWVLAYLRDLGHQLETKPQ